MAHTPQMPPPPADAPRAWHEWYAHTNGYATHGSTIHRPNGATEAHGPWAATGAVIEIIERGSDGDDRHGTIAPNEIRLNGVPLLASREDPVIVHEISTRADELVRVTLTLFARRVSIRAENDIP